MSKHMLSSNKQLRHKDFYDLSPLLGNAGVTSVRAAGPPRVRSCDKRSALHRRPDLIATNNDDGRLPCAIGLLLPARYEYMRAGLVAASSNAFASVRTRVSKPSAAASPRP
jgi:hypothetical protein